MPPIRVLVLALVAALLLAGCVREPAADGAGGAGDGTAETSTAPEPEETGPIDLGGANVVWLGSGEVTFDIAIPEEAEQLYYGLAAQRIRGTVTIRVEGPGCAPQEWTGFFGGGGGTSTFWWCDNPSPESGPVTISMVGVLEGRVCVLVAKSSSEANC